MLPTITKVTIIIIIICFSLSENVPDWDNEIGGLKMIKEQVEEIFGIT